MRANLTGYYWEQGGGVDVAVMDGVSHTLFSRVIS
jgi:hypothetical protein